jgi:hypothetical protein
MKSQERCEWKQPVLTSQNLPEGIEENDEIP